MTNTLEKIIGVVPPVTRQYYKVYLSGNGDSDILDVAGASSVIIISSTVLTIKVPTIDTDGDFTATEAAIVDSDLHKNPTASKAGFISGDVMPPAMILTNASGGASTAYVYITWTR
tara:strand:- start:3125 stop:3472 length:348 start_codon:yes stop_codon:yes gene_type:complete